MVDVKWLKSPEVRSYFKALDDSGGFYRYRWGDACTHFMMASALLDKETEVLRLSKHIPYWHQGSVLMPEYPGLFHNVNV